MGGWGLGALIYSSGYLPYTNPYCLSSAPVVVYDYRQPIQVVYAADPPAVAASSEAMLNEALTAFRQSDYDSALALVNKAIAQFPDDVMLHELRALVLFARSDYSEAAATIHSVLAVGPGWDWATLSSCYADVALYTTQLRRLEQFVREHPQEGAGRFLLAYHYLSTGYPDAAAKQLREVVSLIPNDRVALDLLKMIGASPEEPVPTNSPNPQPLPEVPPTEAIAPTSLIGNWTAQRDDGGQFEMKLAAEGAFTWTFTPPHQQPTTFAGKWTLEGNVLVLERQSGGSLAGEIVPAEPGQFRFKLVGAPPEDQGLLFGQ
ncbi:MAG: tetratricopeptide repeat protein [Planctomycetales bacterium]